MEGRWIWRFHKIGCFIVKSAYRQVVAIREMTEPSTPNEGMSLRDGAGSLWSILWKSRVPPKVKVFMRRLCMESLPKLERLARRNKYIDTCCRACGTTVESSRYVMFECTVPRQMWALALLPWRFVSNWSCSTVEWVLQLIKQESGQIQECFFYALLGNVESAMQETYGRTIFGSLGCVVMYLKKYLGVQKRMHLSI
ncbi:UNVERIFIED_CONTAM: hypothetical protein Scaly_2962200 [Sesamum calycinum]|uniref:Reverse transcriptase zinc-binding domain-containing protein n=1 Tax=Sesamum calycinum TaxID=2727403 RepID=A0AAW2KPW5_9LAMI